MGKFILLIILLAVGAGAVYFYRTDIKRQPADQIAISGNIEITEVEMSFKIPGRVEKRLVSEGDLVKEGQLIATLDSVDLVHEVDLRKAQVEAASAALLELKEGYLPEEIAQAQARAQQAQADLRRSESDYKRQQQLFQQNVISRREFEVSQTNYTVNQAKYQEASKYLQLIQKGTRPEKINQSQAQLQQARQNLMIAETQLGYTQIHSPLTGVVIAKHIEPGEYVMAGTPIVTIGDLDRVWLRGYVNETELGKIKLGQKVQITTDTFPDKIYEGVIVFISPQAEFTPKNVQTEKERVKLVYRIKVDIENSNHELKPGMPADGVIILNPPEQGSREHYPD